MTSLRSMSAMRPDLSAARNSWSGEIRTRAERLRSCLHTLMEGQVLIGVKRVVVDEDADRALVGQHPTRR